MARRVAILGAGAAGLTAIKCCLDEKLEPVCFERTDDIGGLWNFTEEARQDQACVMRSTVINSSKEMTSYSDFPPPKEYPNYMHNIQVKEYFKKYMEAFGLGAHIKFNHEVVSIKQSNDYEETGSWDLHVRDRKTGNEEKMRFDGVLVCTGHHASKYTPYFPGQEDFQGKIIHSQDYKDITGYLGKRVVVIGIGNSGGDVAVELSRVGQVFLSTRRGAWIVNRIADDGWPIDILRSTRFINILRNYVLSEEALNNYGEKLVNKRFDHKLYSLKPKHRLFSQHPTINDDMPNRLACGTVKLKADVKKITKTDVEFVDGTTEDDIDVIVSATGYVFGFPFLDKSVIDVHENKVDLFKSMFPPELPKQTLAVIGFIQPIGSVVPITEMQCRLATRVFKGLVKLPSKSEMWKDIKEKKSKMAKRYVESQRHTIQVDFIDYMDELANMVGCQPNIGGLFLKDVKLAWKLLFGPVTAYQYRLMGPGAWSGAREAIMGQIDRVTCPLKTRPLPEGLDQKKHNLLLKVAVLFIVIAVIYKLLF